MLISIFLATNEGFLWLKCCFFNKLSACVIWLYLTHSTGTSSYWVVWFFFTFCHTLTSTLAIHRNNEILASPPSTWPTVGAAFWPAIVTEPVSYFRHKRRQLNGSEGATGLCWQTHWPAYGTHSSTGTTEWPPCSMESLKDVRYLK